MFQVGEARALDSFGELVYEGYAISGGVSKTKARHLSASGLLALTSNASLFLHNVSIVPATARPLCVLHHGWIL